MYVIWLIITYTTANYIYYIQYRYKQPNSETNKYVEKISSAEDKFDLYLELQSWRKAAEIGYKMRDSQRLEAVGRMCGNSDTALLSSIQDMLAKL